MKKTAISILCFFCLAFAAVAEDVEYHFQEGFATSTPSGWTRTCGSTNATVHTANPALPFAGAYAIKFDATCVDETFHIETPVYSNAGTLSFYIAKNANATQMDLHVLKIVNGVSSEIYSFDAFTAPSKSAEWKQISIVVNETSNVKFKFYSTIREGNTAWFAIDDMELTKHSNTDPGPGEDSVEKVSTDFGDGTWGQIYDAAPSPAISYEVNGFNFVSAAMITGSATCPTGEKHTNRVSVDKSTNNGAIELPLLKTIGELEVHAVTGTADKTFRVDELVSGNWVTLGTYVTRKTPDSVYIIPIARNVETKLRIANNTTSTLIVYKIATRTLSESQQLNITSTTPAEGTTCYYNLTKSVTLTFNKEVAAGTGNITLNDVNIPVASCTIDGKNVYVPVILESTTSGKAYTMTVPQGAFVQKDATSTLSNAKTFAFSTYKTVNPPSGYKALIDVAYSTANADQNRMDIYYPENASKPVPVVINIHGGGWNHGEKESQTGYSTYFSLGFAVANIEYRMTPQATAPAAIEDARCAMKYLLANASTLNIDVNKIVFQGGSAGGHIALTAGYLQNDDKFDNGCSNYNGGYKIIAVIDKYGPSDLANFMSYSSLVAWLGDKKDDAAFIQSISPAKMVTKDTPPTYVIHGDADPTVPYSQSETLVQALIASNVKYKFTTVPGGGHGGFTDEYNTQMEAEIKAFLTEILNTTSINPSIQDDATIVKQNGNVLQINIDGNITAELYRLNGALIQATTNKEIKLNNKGIYLLKITSKDKVYSLKVAY